MRIAIVQVNLIIGDIGGNRDKIIASIKAARELHQADLVIFPELAISSYPPDDLLLRPKVTPFRLLEFYQATSILRVADPIREEVKSRLGALLGAS